MLLKYCVIAVAALGCGPALADANFVKGVYLQSEELCAKAKTDGLQSVIEEGNIMLTARGLESIEYNCEFVQSIKSQRSPAWAVTAICQEPGYVFPDLLSVTEMNPTQFDLVSVRPAETDEGGSANGGSYYLCDGVEAP